MVIKTIYYFRVKQLNSLKYRGLTVLGDTGTWKNIFPEKYDFTKKEVGMHMERVFVKILSIAKCVLNAALAFALVLSF